MNKQLIITLFFVITLLVLSFCKTSTNISNVEPYLDSLTLAITGEKYFELDSILTPHTISVDVFPKNNPAYLFYNHSELNIISVFEIKTGDLIKKIKLEEEGENGVGRNSMTGIYVHNFDSIFFFSMLNQQLFLLDSSSTVKNHYDLMNDESYVQVATLTPAFYSNNELNVSIYPSPLASITSENYAGAKINLITKKLEKVTKLSRNYDKGSWGRHHYLRINQTYNPSQRKYVISFPNDHYLYVYDKNGEFINKKYAGAKKIKNIEPLAASIDEINDLNTFKMEAYQGCYSSIYYDRFNNLYYRFVFNPIDDLYESAWDTEKNVSVIILNKNLERVGEYYFEQDTYSFAATFITKEGLFLLNKKKYNSGNEDKIPFDILNVATLQ